MNYNPYAAPQAGPPMMGAPPPQQGGAQPWEIGEVISLAFDGFKRCWGVLIGAIIVDAIISGIPGQIPNILIQTGAVDAGSAVATILAGVFALIGWVIGCFLATGLYKIYLTAARGAEPNFGDLFSGGSRTLAMMGAQLLMALILIPAFLLLIVPGVIVALGLAFTTYYVADAGLGPIDAMKASWAAMNGSKGKLFLLGLLSILIAIVGLLACCIGIFAASAVLQLANAIIFVRISGRGTTPSGFDPNAMGGGYPPPGGYGGPPGGGYGGPPPGGAPPGYGGPPQGGGGYGGPPQGGGGGYGGPPQGGGGMPPPGGGGGYGGPPGY